MSGYRELLALGGIAARSEGLAGLTSEQVKELFSNAIKEFPAALRAAVEVEEKRYGVYPTRRNAQPAGSQTEVLPSGTR